MKPSGTYGDSLRAQSSQKAGVLMMKIGGSIFKEDKIKAVLASAPVSFGVKCIEAERDKITDYEMRFVDCKSHVIKPVLRSRS